MAASGAVTVPHIDFSAVAASLPDPAVTEAALTALGRQLVAAFTSVGFCYMEGHGLDADLMEGSLDMAQRLFALPVDVKRKILRRHGVDDHCGWTPLPNTPGLDVETEVFDARLRPDHKETYNISVVSPDDKFLPEADLPGFRDRLQRLVDAYHVLTRRILLAVGLALDLPDPSALLRRVEYLGRSLENDSLARFAFYPRLGPRDNTDDLTRCTEHTDSGLVTFLFQNAISGLQVFTRAGRYLDVKPSDGAVLINVGDSLERLTGGVLVSAKHRVMVDARLGADDRYCIVYFVVADQSAVLEALCGDRERYGEQITSGDFLQRRIVDVFSGKGLGINTTA